MNELISYIAKIAEGLRTGISKFYRPSKVALLYALTSDDDIYIFDPQNLLRDHEPKIKELFLEKEFWKKERTSVELYDHQNWIHFAPDLQLSGLVSFGGWSKPIFYQMWFVQHYPEICSIGPLLRWLESATWLLAQAMVLKDDMAVENSKIMIQNMVVHSIRDFIVDQRNMTLGLDTKLRIYPILETIGTISKTKEEGSWARGKLAFIEPFFKKEIKFLASFSPKETPEIIDYKHVRKLLTAVQNTDYYLISDGEVVLGIAKDPLPPGTIWADFRGSYGYLHLDKECICTLEDGHFTLRSRKSSLEEFEELLLDRELNGEIKPEESTKLFNVVKEIVHFAQERGFGCGLIVDFNIPPVEIMGQRFISSLDLSDKENLTLAKSLARMDGALHIGKNLSLYGFGCLMDGKRVITEDRSRGARYNSALRFTREHKDVIVVVVSVDRPVSVIYDGKEKKEFVNYKKINYEDYLFSIKLKDW